jgi:hypothetical protein
MSDDPRPAPALLILCRDLLLGSKITAAAQSAGVAYRVVRDAAKLEGLAGERLIVDLNQDGALDAAVAWKRAGGAKVIGFVSHVDAETIQRAQAAGLDQIVPRSRFVVDLPQIVKATVS